jgi:hypothetical protein
MKTTLLHVVDALRCDDDAIMFTDRGGQFGTEDSLNIVPTNYRRRWMIIQFDELQVCI